MKFKKIIVILMAILMLVSLTACADKSGAPDGMKNAAREEDPFYLYVPESWMTNKGDVVGAYYSSYDKSNITVIPYGGDLTSSEEYWNDFKTRCAAEFAEFEVVGENEAKVISQRNALQYTYTLKIDGVSYKCQQTVLTYGNLLYVITYTASADKYDAHIDDINSILSVFSFK
jgi:hypothetical protein